LLNNQWIIGVIREEIKTFLESNENENNLPDSLEYIKSSAKRKGYSYENRDLK
jgi:predicted house-cleaning noncanonical NTP pyrophosphatase (MazG superfamily)